MKIAADELRKRGGLWYTSNRQKRHYFLTSYVKLAQVKREKLHKEPAKRGCVYLGAFLSRFP